MQQGITWPILRAITGEIEGKIIRIYKNIILRAITGEIEGEIIRIYKNIINQFRPKNITMSEKVELK